jgi:hypothetical protein
MAGVYEEVVPAARSATGLGESRRLSSSATAATVSAAWTLVRRWLLPPSCLQSLSGQLCEYEHRYDESGRWLRHRFCVRGGPTVLISLEHSPRIGLHLGSSNDPEQLVPTRHVFIRSKRSWVRIPDGATTFPGMPPPPPAPLH